MLRKRIIFSLIYSDGFFNQSRNFRLQRVGDEKWLENNYKFSKIAHSLDELILIDASKPNKNIQKFSETITKIVEHVFIPICAGGGINNVCDAELLFNSGADKVLLNSSLFDKPNFVIELVKIYGSQSIVASIDYKIKDNTPLVFINNGTTQINLDIESYINQIQSLGIGEIYLNSIDKDGTGFGYDISFINTISNKINVPLIIAGGAGNENHLFEGLSIEDVSGVATANLFNFIGDGLPDARQKIFNKGLNISNWQTNNL
uniref:HisA/HisF-related TIM barrel protein n=1 Tax=Algoriphagus sp. TaxID=1872435 RepID=UPI0040473F1C